MMNRCVVQPEENTFRLATTLFMLCQISFLFSLFSIAIMILCLFLSTVCVCICIEPGVQGWLTPYNVFFFFLFILLLLRLDKTLIKVQFTTCLNITVLVI